MSDPLPLIDDRMDDEVFWRDAGAFGRLVGDTVLVQAVKGRDVQTVRHILFIAAELFYEGDLMLSAPWLMRLGMMCGHLSKAYPAPAKRDPRDKHAAAVALSRVLNRTQMKAQSKGVNPLAEINAVVCPFFDPEQGKLMPDNLIEKCARCGEALQRRPVLTFPDVTYLCVYCADDAVQGD